MDTADLENRLSPRMSYMTLKKPMESKKFLYPLSSGFFPAWFQHIRSYSGHQQPAKTSVPPLVFSMFKKHFWIICIGIALKTGYLFKCTLYQGNFCRLESRYFVSKLLAAADFEIPGTRGSHAFIIKILEDLLSLCRKSQEKFS